MIDVVKQPFIAVQSWLFEQALQPLLFALELMPFAENVYDGLGVAMLGVLEIAVLCLLLKPLEAWRPVERWNEKRAVRADVIYTWLNRLGVLPLLIFFLLVVPVDEIDAWLRMHDIVRPNIEDLIPEIGRAHV
mgnify:FL=1